MKACLALLSYYKECVHNIRDSLGVGTQPMSHYPSMSSVVADSPLKGFVYLLLVLCLCSPLQMES